MAASFELRQFSTVKIAIVGAGWAGCAAAVEATRRGHQVTVFEAARNAGGRARRVDVMLDGQARALDNGQHILIGAYTETLKLMAELGVDASSSLLRMPLTLQFPDGHGLRLPALPAPLDALVGICTARGWSWRDKLSLLKVCAQWQLRRFACPPHVSVASLCSGVSRLVMQTLIEPLCVSALNTPSERASAQVFLRVMRDALFAGNGGSNLLLPQVNLGALLPDAALSWLQREGAAVWYGQRVLTMTPTAAGWALGGEGKEGIGGWGVYDGIILACAATDAVRLVRPLRDFALPCEPWLTQVQQLEYEAIATVYAMANGTRLAQPMLALRSSSEQPAQFVFDRGQLGGPAGLLAFVISASASDGATLRRQVQAQAAAQLGLHDLQILQTIVEKRATFACAPGLKRPGLHIAPGLLACGDYVDGPYPATLEGAVRSGLQAARQLRNIY